MNDLQKGKDFWEIWQEFYQELCVLKCQVSGLSQDHLPEELQFGLHIQVERLFELHNQFIVEITEIPE